MARKSFKQRVYECAEYLDRNGKKNREYLCECREVNAGRCIQPGRGRRAQNYQREGAIMMRLSPWKVRALLECGALLGLAQIVAILSHGGVL